MTKRSVLLEVVATIGLVALGTSLVISGPAGPVRAVVGGALAVFAPGYAVSTLLFPRSSENRRLGKMDPSLSLPTRASLPFVERMAFAFGASVATIPVLAWLLAGLGFQYTVRTTAGAVGVFSIVVLLLGMIRRLRTPDDARYVFTVTAVRNLATYFDDDRDVARVSKVALMLSVIVAVAVLTAGLVAPMQGSSYTQVSVLTEGENGLEFVGESTKQLRPGGTADLVFRLENREGTATNYTVVVASQGVENGQVVSQTYVNRFSKQVEASGTWQHPHQVTPRRSSAENVRIAYLVYRGQPPADPSVASAYRTVTVWASEPGTGGQG